MRERYTAAVTSRFRRISAILLVTAILSACTPHGKTSEDEQRQKTAQVVADAAVSGNRDRLLSLASAESTEPEQQVDRLISSARGKSSTSEVTSEKKDEASKRYVVTVGQGSSAFSFELAWNDYAWQLALDAKE